MGKRARRRLRPLVRELERVRPDIEDPETLIAAGAVRVDGRILTNPQSRVAVGASIVVRPPKPLRGEAKLRAALAAFPVHVRGSALDVGAAAGGFTRVLLEAGAVRVHAVDAGFGQLVGSLRSDRRVVNLEGVNLADVDVADEISIVTIDVSYIALADAVPQLERVRFAPGADLVALVKPMYELHLGKSPSDPERAVPVAIAGLERAPWHVRACMRSPVQGSRGAHEFLLWAQRT